jgi:preprotein translocase subunit SecF
MQLFTNTNFNFIRWRWHALVLSLLIVVAGVAAIVVQGMPLGIDFSGGTQLIVRFDQPVALDAVRGALADMPGDKVVQQYDDPATRQVLIRLQETGGEQGRGLEQTSRQVEEALERAELPSFRMEGQDLVGPTIGADLQRRGIYATVASLLAITIYIGFRFRFSFAVGAIAATLHDVFVTLAFLQFGGYELSLNVVAAILTITGYSVNDTIVVFDRVRENLRANRREPLEQVVNRSVNQTLARTVITAGTTFMAVLSLFLFGGEVLRGFAFTMIVGIVSGTYSTVFIASSIAIILSQRRSRKLPSAAAPPAVAPAAAPTTAPTTGRSKAKKRAS